VKQCPDDSGAVGDGVKLVAAKFGDHLLVADVISDVVEQRVHPDDVGLVAIDELGHHLHETRTGVGGVAVDDDAGLEQLLLLGT